MGINLNNNQNSFGKLTTANLNQAKATKNAGNIVDAKALDVANAAKTLNSATLKANQGSKIDTNNFGKTDIMPVEEQKIQEAKAKKSWGKLFMESLTGTKNEKNQMLTLQCSNDTTIGSAAPIAAIVATVKWLLQ